MAKRADPNIPKPRNVYLNSHQWRRVQFYTRLLESKKGLPHGSLSRQSTIQMLADQMPDPPGHWKSGDRLPRGFQNESEELPGLDLESPEPEAAHEPEDQTDAAGSGEEKPNKRFRPIPPGHRKKRKDEEA